MNKIVYTATENGVDGRGKSKIMIASFDEEELKLKHNKSKNRKWLFVGMKIIDDSEVRAQAIKKLDAVELLVLGIEL